MSEMVFWWRDRVLWEISRFASGSLGFPGSGSVAPRLIPL